jgi:acyl-CoA synthetase (AMP-forming)/AMP-acid ligase II
MNLAEILQLQARARPGATAIIEGQQCISFAELDQAAARAAALLIQSGLKRGDAVLVFQTMSIELYVALAAIFRLGLVAVFVDPSAGRAHLECCCAIQPPKALIAGTRGHLLQLWSSALRAIPIKFAIGCWVPGAIRWNRAARMPPCETIVPCSPDSPALLTFTSGSTGQPRAALRTHGFLLAQHAVLETCLRPQASDVDLTTMPIVLLTNLASGVTSLIAAGDLRRPGAIDPAPVLAQLQEHRVVSSVASPAFFEAVTRYALSKNVKVPSIRKLFTGGGPVFPHLLGQLQQVAPNAEVVAVYGSTEAEPIAHVTQHEMDSADRAAMLTGRGLLAGLPVDAIAVRILKDRWRLGGIAEPIGPFRQAEFAAECLPAEQPGEIVVSGPHVLPGYLHGHGDEETKFQVDGTIWHRTGDAGYLDQRGRLWLLGRCAARIEDQHGILYPLAAETVLYQNPHIRRAVLMERAGRRILALEYADRRRPASDADLAEVRRQFHVDEICVCKQIPVDHRHNAKIDYPRLHAMLDQG